MKRTRHYHWPLFSDAGHKFNNNSKRAGQNFSVSRLKLTKTGQSQAGNMASGCARVYSNTYCMFVINWRLSNAVFSVVCWIFVSAKVENRCVWEVLWVFLCFKGCRFCFECDYGKVLSCFDIYDGVFVMNFNLLLIQKSKNRCTLITFEFD